MRMRFKQQLSALIAALGFTPKPPKPPRMPYQGGRRIKPPSGGKLKQRSHKRTLSLFARLHPARVVRFRHLWPPQERSRRPEWSSAVPGEWSTERGDEARA